MLCAKCNYENPADALFCMKCGAKVERHCPSCNTLNPNDANFCRKCGAPLGTNQAAFAHKPAGVNAPKVEDTSERPVADIPEGERKTVTALFADIKGSTELQQDLDPEEARAIIDPALKIMIDAARHYDGYVQNTGDGIFALFGAPVAHEDHPQRALHAALRMQQEIRRYGDRLLETGGVPIEIRVGINTGEVVMRPLKTGDSQAEYAPIGHTTNLASRMQAVARSGSVVVSEATRKLVEGYFQLKGIGPTKVKGISEPIQVYEVVGLGPLRTRLQRAASRGYTKFVGREPEMEALRRSGELARQGHGQIAAAIADAGVGKSRLYYEFKAISQSGWLVLEAPSVSHGKASAYMPVIDMLRGYFGIEDSDEPRKRREKVIGKGLGLDRSLEDTLPYLFGLLGLAEGDDPLSGMDAQIRRRRTHDALKRIIVRESLNQPLMLIFEDLHWIDEETQAFLNFLAEGIANAPVLLLVNYRPDYSHTWGSKTYYTQLRLDPLRQESAGEMLDALVDDSPEMEPLKRLVLERTEGNPLFIEELVEALFEEGVLVRNGAIKVTRPLSQLKIPLTVQAILAARIDRLSPEAKELLQTMAVVGMEFPLALLSEIVQQPPEQLDGLLGGLQKSEFIYEQPAAGDVEYTFKHALTHDVAYNLLLTERRRLLHARTGQAIEAVYHERLEDHYSDLAHHYRSSNNTAKAVDYLRLAGEQAARRGAHAQALANVEPALKLIERLPEGAERLRAELGVRLLEGMVTPTVYGLASVERMRTSERLCELSERLGDTSALLLGLANVGFVYHFRLELPRALEIARRCAQVVEQNLNGETPPYVQFLLAVCAMDSGDLLQARSLFTDLMDRVRSAHGQAATELRPWNIWVLSPDHLAEVQLELGRPDAAVKLSNEALRRGRELKDPFNLLPVTFRAGILRYYLREPQAARALAEAAIALTEGNNPYQIAQGRWFRDCWATAEPGPPETRIDELKENVTLFPDVMQIEISGMLAQLCIDARQSGRALKVLDEGLGKCERLGVQVVDTELHRLRGEAILLRDSSATAEAEKAYRKSIEIANAQSAKWWELRASVGLARLLRKTDRRDEARTMLAEIYNWFTEGFDTADLKDAKALLGELNL